jgi:uncharacterized membrane protein YhaH (DUF805 family)
MELLWRPWRLYADFSGRSSRTEFGLFFISFYGMVVLLLLLAVALGSNLLEEGAGFGWGFGLLLIWVLAAIVPSWAVTVRRLHDQDKSGWFILLTLIPYLGFLFWLIFAFWPGTEGENDYGWNPRDGANPADHLEKIFS